MTWLSEIEDKKYASWHRHNQIPRMARVIRELAGYAMIVRDTGSVIDIHERESRAYYNLSPDAKELLEQVTTSVVASDSAEE